jgi:FkbM family methyltransferase
MTDFRRHLVSFLSLPGIRQAASASLRAVLTLGGVGNGAGGFTVMQVGARGGADPYTKWLRHQRKIKTIGVEPEQSGLEKLRRTKGFDYVVPHAFSDAPGTGTLHVTKARGWCSLLKPDESAIRKVATPACLHARPFEVVSTEQVKLTTIDAIGESLPSVDYLQIDVQGAELSVLRGAVRMLKNVRMLELEARFYPIYHEEPRFAELHDFLTSHGFLLFSMARQGETEFGETYAETNACYYNVELALKEPSRMAALRHYAKAKHAHYANPFLRMLGDIHSSRGLTTEVIA